MRTTRATVNNQLLRVVLTRPSYGRRVEEIWSSLWVKRPDARVQFDLEDSDGGTELRWTLYVDEPVPDQSLTGHLRKRMNELINANLRYTYGQ